MSEILDCDPSRGFVAFPVALFDLDLTPGAFRTLAELCRMANRDGQCWPSLAQLGRRLGRSRAAVSGYIGELRAAAVLTTEEQRMANGYNYRLRYTVTFWKEWRGSIGKDVQKAERTVRPAERPLETKNHIHINHESENILKASKTVSDWTNMVGKAPYPGFENWPDTVLIQQSEAIVARKIDDGEPFISADIEAAISQFLSERGLPNGEAQTLGSALRPHLRTRKQLADFMELLRQHWQPHWQKPPTAHQIARLIRDMPQASDEISAQKLVKSYLRRWKLYCASLPSGGTSGTVAVKQYPRI